MISLASANGYAGMVQLMIDNGAEVEEAYGEAFDKAPLYHAANNGHLKIVKLLVDNGALLSQNPLALQEVKEWKKLPQGEPDLNTMTEEEQIDYAIRKSEQDYFEVPDDFHMDTDESDSF